MKKLVSKLCISDITPPLRFLLLEEPVGSSLFLILSSSFHFLQFLSYFFKYLSSNFSSSHLYNIFTIYFSGNFPLLKSFFLPNLNFPIFILLHSFFLQTLLLTSLHSPNSLAFSNYYILSQTPSIIPNTSLLSLLLFYSKFSPPPIP